MNKSYSYSSQYYHVFKRLRREKQKFPLLPLFLFKKQRTKYKPHQSPNQASKSPDLLIQFNKEGSVKCLVVWCRIPVLVLVFY